MVAKQLQVVGGLISGHGHLYNWASKRRDGASRLSKQHTDGYSTVVIETTLNHDRTLCPAQRMCERALSCHEVQSSPVVRLVRLYVLPQNAWVKGVLPRDGMLKILPHFSDTPFHVPRRSAAVTTMLWRCETGL